MRTAAFPAAVSIAPRRPGATLDLRQTYETAVRMSSVNMIIFLQYLIIFYPLGRLGIFPPGAAARPHIALAHAPSRR
jgi:hypothetical protein